MAPVTPVPLKNKASPGHAVSRTIEFPLNADQVRSLLPHRWPFLFLDQVLEVSPEGKGRGIKNVTVSEPHFMGHFPSQSVMPGVLIVEALAQLAGITAVLSARQSSDESSGQRPGRNYLACINRMRFHRLARPADQLELTAQKRAATLEAVEFAVSARTAGQLVASGQLILAV
jgi:3-hydroxyacyl-[acyl-carrier-protein] dehydratase